MKTERAKAIVLGKAPNATLRSGSQGYAIDVDGFVFVEGWASVWGAWNAAAEKLAPDSVFPPDRIVKQWPADLWAEVF